jgi:hypothetical protein
VLGPDHSSPDREDGIGGFRDVRHFRGTIGDLGLPVRSRNKVRSFPLVEPVCELINGGGTVHGNRGKSLEQMDEVFKSATGREDRLAKREIGRRLMRLDHVDEGLDGDV